MAMQDYETRIINAVGELSLVAVDRHTSDFSAIRAALRLCRQGETAQVWRGNECVYSDLLHSHSGLAWPVRSKSVSPEF
jgi:hypothetical protein